MLLNQIVVFTAHQKNIVVFTYLGGFSSDLQVGKHSTRQSWPGSKKYAICK